MKAKRSRSDNKQYTKYLRETRPNDDCAFCSMTSKHEQFVSESQYFMVIRNIFPYTVWDTQPVAEHLMLIPKKHTNTLKDLSLEESAEFINLISDFEADNFNIYARAPSSNQKSMTHQHTHLIKLTTKPKPRVTLSTAKPFLKFSN